MTLLKRLLPFLVLLAGLPPIVYGVLALKSNSSDIAQWLPDGRESRREYARFVELFGADDSVFVSWEGCRLDDPRVASLQAALAEPPANGEQPLIADVVTGPELLEELTDDEIGLTHDEAIARLSGSFVDEAGELTGLSIRLTDTGKRSQKDVIAKIENDAERLGLSPSDLRMGGSAYEAAMIDLESFRSYREYIPAIAVVTALIAWCCFRDVLITLVVLLLGSYCRFLAAAAIHLTGGYVNAVLIVMPLLIYVLTISAAVHLANYYLDTARERGLAGAGRRALHIGWAPCALASGSTAIGLASLAISEIGPIKSFGVYASCLLMVCLLVLFAFLPWALDSVSSLRRDRLTPKAFGGNQILGRFRTAMAAWVTSYPVAVMTVCLVLLGALGWGIAYTKTSVKLEDMFRDESDLIRNYRWLESEIGPLIPVEVLVHIDADSPLDELQQVELIGEIERDLRNLDDVGGTLAATTLLPDVPQGTGTRIVSERAGFRRKLINRRDRLVEHGYLADDGDRAIWRITARVPAMHEDDYDVFIANVRGRAERTLANWRDAGGRDEGVRLTYTGLLPMFHKSQQQLLTDLINSFGLAVVLICPVMIFVLRSPLAGVLAMIPNLAPIAMVFGVMGWLGVRVDIGTVLTASIALGIAIDDTLHFLTWFRRGTNSGLSIREAVLLAYDKCAAAMFQTTVICGLGLLVLAHSSFVPTSTFAVLICCLLFAALVGDLILLPAMLAGPFGFLFRSKPNQQTSTTELALERSLQES